jgi:hypothetical protein
MPKITPKTSKVVVAPKPLPPVQTPTVVSDPDSPWRPREITIPLLGKPTRIAAHCLGMVAVHPSPEEEEEVKGKWALTAISIGYRIAMTTLEADARKIGEVLWSRFRKEIQQDNPFDMRQSLPQWVKNWLIACREKLAYLDPKEYQR